MFAAFSMSSGPSVVSDPYWASTSVLCGFNSSVVDESSAPKAMTTTVSIDVNGKFGGSLKFVDGASDYARVTTEIALSQQFTVEAWVYLVDTADQHVASGITGNCQLMRLGYPGVGAITCYLNGLTLSSANGLYTSGTWNHFAISRDATNVRLFVNGVVAATNASTESCTFGAIGAFFFNGSFNTGSFNGYIDEFRVTNGVARYTSNFTVPTAAFPRS